VLYIEIEIAGKKNVMNKKDIVKKTQQIVGLKK
jgi:hypothetical protein